LLDRRFCGLPRGPSTVTSLDLIETLTVEDVESVLGLVLVQLFSSPATRRSPRCLILLPCADQDIKTGVLINSPPSGTFSVSFE
jgi:hypothetical protein